jgi:hypothetical protein
MFKDGIAQSLTINTAIGSNSLPDITSTFNIGYSTATGYQYYLNGYIDEFRVSKGIARWTTAFTPPSSAYHGKSLFYLNSDGTETEIGAGGAAGRWASQLGDIGNNIFFKTNAGSNPSCPSGYITLWRKWQAQTWTMPCGSCSVPGGWAQSAFGCEFICEHYRCEHYGCGSRIEAGEYGYIQFCTCSSQYWTKTICVGD